MREFAELYRKIDATTSTNKKVAAMEAFFSTADEGDAAWAAHLLMDRGRRRYATSRLLLESLEDASELPPWLLEECRAHVGDSAETVALILHRERQERGTTAGAGDKEEECSLRYWMEERVPTLRHLSEEEKKAVLLSWWEELPTFELFIFNKLLTGGFRVGVSRTLVVRALARAFDLPEPLLTHRLTGEWSPSGDFFRRLTAPAGEGERPPSQPYPFFLAYPLETGSLSDNALREHQVEWKYDGIRAQLIQRSGEVYIWSRGEELVTNQFPELREAAGSLPDGTVLDGEIVAWNGKEPLPFNYLQRRLGRKRVTGREMRETPVHLIVYDCLEAEGEDIRSRPLTERRRRLEEIVRTSADPAITLSPTVAVATMEELEERRRWAREHGVEGLMLKRRDAPYGEGRKKGPWWKYKVDPYRLEAVLIYAQAGSGKRANLFTDYTFGLWREGELVPFAKAYSGLSNEEIRELDRWIRRNTVEKYGPARAIRPEQVFEIAFEGIARSKRHKSGVAVRFPRIARWRKDKPPEEADTLERAYELIP